MPCSLKQPVLCSLRALIVALNDEVAQVRATAIASIGRVSARNPAYAMPALRRHLMQLLADMNQAPESRQREGETRLWSIATGAVPSSCCVAEAVRTAQIRHLIQLLIDLNQAGLAVGRCHSGSRGNRLRGRQGLGSVGDV